MTLTLTIPARSVVIMSHPENGQEIARFVVVRRTTLRFAGVRVDWEPCAKEDALQPYCAKA